MPRRRYRYHRYYDFFPRSVPRKAKGGIKAQSKRGTFGGSWWARRWIAVLEGFDIGARLGRGRSYARRGQVLSINIDKGRVSAKVQGSRSRPYDVVIKVKTLSAAEWKKLAKALSRQALFAAKLLSGEMPQDIEAAFKAARLSLFPERLRDLVTDCSCPDWSNPCKHIAAVYYLIGEEFDRDPFLLFKLRGMSREEVIGLLDRSGGNTARARRAKPASAEPQEAPPAPEPQEKKAAHAPAVPVNGPAQAGENLGRGLGLVQDRQVRSGYEAFPFKVEAQALGFLLQVEIGPAHGLSQGRLAALARPDERHGRIGIQSLQDQFLYPSPDHALYFRNRFLFCKIPFLRFLSFPRSAWERISRTLCVTPRSGRPSLRSRPPGLRPTTQSVQAERSHGGPWERETGPPGAATP